MVRNAYVTDLRTLQGECSANYLRLIRLVGDMEEGQHRSIALGDKGHNTLHLYIHENAPYTEPMRREVHMRKDAVGVLLYDVAQDALVLVEQFRAGAVDDPATPWKLEFVAGLVEAGESLEEVACREAQEESGCCITELKHLHTYYPSPGACNERVTLFCGLVDSQGVGGIHGLKEEHEDIRVHVMSFHSAWALLEQGRLDNAMSLIGMHWLAGQRASLRALPDNTPRFS